MSTIKVNTIDTQSGTTITIPTGKVLTITDNSGWSIAGTVVASTAAELNILDGKAFLDEDAMGSNSATGIASQQSIKAYIDNLYQYGTIYVDAGAMVTTTTAGAEAATNEYATNDVNWDYYAFDTGGTEEQVQFKIVMPENWDRSTVKAKFYWSSATGSSAGDTCEWAIKATALANDDAIDASWGTEQVITDTVLAGTNGDIHITSATPAITVAGSPALGEMITFEVNRNTAGTDDMAEDAWLFGVLIQIKMTSTVSAW